MDSTDQKLLGLLSMNSRLSFAELGRKINLSPSSVRERMQRLEDTGIIKKYSIQLDERKLGFELEAFMLLKLFPGQ